jgi:hypothetical protein
MPSDDAVEADAYSDRGLLDKQHTASACQQSVAPCTGSVKTAGDEQREINAVLFNSENLKVAVSNAPNVESHNATPNTSPFVSGALFDHSDNPIAFHANTAAKNSKSEVDRTTFHPASDSSGAFMPYRLSHFLPPVCDVCGVFPPLWMCCECGGNVQNVSEISGMEVAEKKICKRGSQGMMEQDDKSENSGDDLSCSESDGLADLSDVDSEDDDAVRIYAAEVCNTPSPGKERKRKLFAKWESLNYGLYLCDFCDKLIHRHACEDGVEKEGMHM